MSDDAYSFSTARVRLEEIVTQVRKKDTSLEKSLDLLEEGVRLANTCTELIDHADWTAGGVEEPAEEVEAGDESTPVVEGEGADDAAASDDDAECSDDSPKYRDDEA